MRRLLRSATLAGCLLAAAPVAAALIQEASRPPPPAGDDFQPLALPAELSGRTYYLLEAGLTCRSNTPAHTRIRTWRERILFENGRVLVWGNLCNDAAIELSQAEAQAQLKVHSGRDAVQYRNRTLIYAAEPPKLCDSGIWCPVADIRDGR